LGLGRVGFGLEEGAVGCGSARVCSGSDRVGARRRFSQIGTASGRAGSDRVWIGSGSDRMGLRSGIGATGGRWVTGGQP
jgi:hypothetical protein